MTKKYYNIQALRGIAALFVVFSHLVRVEDKYAHGVKILPDFLLQGIYGVDLFFVISGCVMILITEGASSISAKSPVLFLFRRTTRIFPLYWFYTTCTLVAFLIMPAWVNNSQGHHVNILTSYLLFPSSFLPLLMVGWSLIYEMYFYYVFTLFLVLKKRIIVSLGTWFFALIALNLLWHLVYRNNEMPAVINVFLNPLCLEFILGAFVGVAIIKRYVFFPRLICGVGCFLLALVIGTELINSLTLGGNWGRFLLYGFPFSLIVYGVLGLEICDRRIAPAWMCSLGDISYSMYLLHVLLLSAIGRVFYILPWHTITTNTIVFTFMISAVIFASFISYKYLELPVIELFRKSREGVASTVIPG